LKRRLRGSTLGLALFSLAASWLPARAAGDLTTGSVSGLPVPRFEIGRAHV